MSSLDSMKSRLQVMGGDHHGRNVQGKLKSFHAALKNSYQYEIITLDKGDETERKYECLINPSRLTEQFDRKVISIDFEAGLKEGDVFYWDRTKKYWIVNLQQYTEEAYFRALITEAENYIDIDGKRYWIYLRGPKEEKFKWNQKHGLYYNDLNYSLEMTIKKDKTTLDYFSRFNIIEVFYSYFDDNGEEQYSSHRWQVAATDKYSSKTTITVHLDEYADNDIEKEMIPPKEKEFQPGEIHIEGPQLINPYDENIIYKVPNELTDGTFVVNSNKVKITKIDDNTISLDVLTGKATDIEIYYKKEGQDDLVLPVKILSL